MGILGDFVFADVNRFGGSIGATVAGPIWDRFNTLRNFVVGNAVEAFDGTKQKTNVGREAVNVLRQNMPGLSSLWFARTAYERVVLDQLQYLLDPDAHAAFRRKEETRRKQIGNSFWWRPGQFAPGS